MLRKTKGENVKNCSTYTVKILKLSQLTRYARYVQMFWRKMLLNMSKLAKKFSKHSLVFLLSLVVLISFVSCEKEKEDDDFSQSMKIYARSFSRVSDCLRTKNYYAYIALIPRIKDESSSEIEISYTNDQYAVIHTGKIKDYFVTYEDISIVGNFVGYGEIAYEEHGLVRDHYLAYILQDTLFSKVELHIIHTKQEGLGEEEYTLYGLSRLAPSCVAPDSKMRTLLPEYVGGYVDVGDVRYLYTHGKLQGIKWVHAGFEFILREFENYPADCTHTFIGKLLDPTLVGDAVTLFNQQFDVRREARQ